MNQATRTTALVLALLLTACAAQQQPHAVTAPVAVEHFDHAGFKWTRWSDGTVTSNDGHVGRTDPRLPLCRDSTLTSRADRLKRGGAYSSECRVK